MTDPSCARSALLPRFPGMHRQQRNNDGEMKRPMPLSIGTPSLRSSSNLAVGEGYLNRMSTAVHSPHRKDMRTEFSDGKRASTGSTSVYSVSASVQASISKPEGAQDSTLPEAPLVVGRHQIFVDCGNERQLTIDTGRDRVVDVWGAGVRLGNTPVRNHEQIPPTHVMRTNDERDGTHYFSGDGVHLRIQLRHQPLG